MTMESSGLSGPICQHNWLSSHEQLSVDPVVSPAGQTTVTQADLDPCGDLELLRRQHQLILNAVGEGIYGLDLQGRVTFANPAAAAMIGWEVAGLIGQSMHAVLHHSRADGSPYPREECPIYAAFQDGAVRRVNHEVFWRKDGTSFPVEYISTPMRDERGNLIGSVVTFRDITKQKWAEAVLQQVHEELDLKVRERTAELHRANEQLKELNDLKSRFVAIVCHEFRNPLNNITLSVSSLNRYEHQLSADQKLSYLEDIADNVERMTSMIDDILVISKIEAKRLDVKPAKTDFIQFCCGLIAEIEATTQRSIKLSNSPRHLVGVLDRRLLRSILTNILMNSVRYSPEDSLIQLKLFRRKDWITFQVTDEGIGIPPEDQPYLFEPFQRGRNVSNIPGTGLGLNIVKRFVDLQDGKIEIKSAVGQGTTFKVSLPSQPGT